MIMYLSWNRGYECVGKIVFFCHIQSWLCGECVHLPNICHDLKGNGIIVSSRRHPRSTLGSSLTNFFGLCRNWFLRRLRHSTVDPPTTHTHDDCVTQYNFEWKLFFRPFLLRNPPSHCPNNVGAIWLYYLKETAVGSDSGYSWLKASFRFPPLI